MIENTRNLLENPNGPSLFSSTCIASSGKFFPFVKPYESEQISYFCNPKPENIVSCKNPELETFLDEIDGLDFGTVTSKGITFPIPNFIPILNRDASNMSPDAVSNQVIGISLKDLVSSPPQKRYGRVHADKFSLRKGVLEKPIFRDKKIILFGSGRDSLIERLWQELYEIRFSEYLSSIGITVATGFCFSVIVGDCPVGQSINLKKSLKTVEYFQKAGIEAIPHIYSLNSNHISRWNEWLKNNPLVRIVAINCQFSRNRKAAMMQCNGIKLLKENLNRKITFLLEGPSKFLLHQLQAYGCSKNIKVAAQGPFEAAKNGRLYSLKHGKLKERRINLSVEELCKNNIRVYSDYIRSIISLKRSKKVTTNQLAMFRDAHSLNSYKLRNKNLALRDFHG